MPDEDVDLDALHKGLGKYLKQVSDESSGNRRPHHLREPLTTQLRELVDPIITRQFGDNEWGIYHVDDVQYLFLHDGYAAQFNQKETKYLAEFVRDIITGDDGAEMVVHDAAEWGEILSELKSWTKLYR